MKDFIANLKEKPEHIRKRVAVGTSAGITGLVGVIWAGTMVSSGTLALGSGVPVPADTAPKTDSFALSGTNVQSNFSQLLGAVGAATNSTTSKPALVIIDGGTSSSFKTNSNATNQSATIIPF